MSSDVIRILQRTLVGMVNEEEDAILGAIAHIQALEAELGKLRKALLEAKSMLAICQWEDGELDAGYDAAWNKGLATINKALEDEKK